MAQFGSTLLDWLIAPHPRVTSAERIQQSRLLSAILLVLLGIGATILAVVLHTDADDIDAPEVRGALLLLVIDTLMYALSRLGHYHTAAAGIILPFVAVFIYIPFNSPSKTIFLAFLIIPIVLTAIFFSLRWTAVAAAVVLTTVLILLSFQDHTSSKSPYWGLRDIWFLLLLATGLILTFIWHLGNLESLRRRELKYTNQQLEQEIAELERFTYTVSHELRSPLVTIMGFSGMLEEEIRHGDYSNIPENFRRITHAIEKMQNSLSDLLELSRVGRITNPSEDVSLAELVQEARASLDGRLRAGNITLKVAPNLPVVYADRLRLREVFEGLMENAAKYMGHPSAPLIEVGARQNGGETVIFVRDNGIGIDLKYHTKIFGLFEKLDSVTEGTGVGLAIIKRIIELHGGRIWVESEGPGKGSTFCFTIPPNKKDEPA